MRDSTLCVIRGEQGGRGPRQEARFYLTRQPGGRLGCGTRHSDERFAAVTSVFIGVRSVFVGVYFGAAIPMTMNFVSQGFSSSGTLTPPFIAEAPASGDTVTAAGFQTSALP